MNHIKPHIEEIALKNGFKNFKLIFETGSDLGFIGILKRCRIIEDGRELSLFCKFLPDDNDRNSKFNSFLLFEREVLIYKNLFPIFVKFQKDYGIDESDSDGFWSFPKCFYCNYDKINPTNSIIIMEDLTVNDFEVKDKYVPSDFQHTSKLFTELAKLHGLTLAINKKNPQLLEEFKFFKNQMCNLMQTESMKDIAPRNFKLIIQLFQNENDEEIIGKLLPYKDNLWKQISESLDKAGIQTASVICHGDVWINNVLYNYYDYKKEFIKDIKLVDWQITHFGSAGAELAYYLFCCTEDLIRKNRQQELFQLYHNTMKQFLRKFDLNIKLVFPYELLKEQIRTFGLYAFGMANFAIPILCKYPEMLIEDGTNVTQLTDEEKECVQNFNSRMRQIILEMIDMEIL